MGGLYVLFIAVPLIEIALLIQVGTWIGTIPTVGLVVATAVVGASLARWQGLSTLERARSMARAGTIPAGPVFDGVLILLAAVLLLTPGILTDAVGFLLLVPVVRRAVRTRIMRRIEAAEEPGGKVDADRPRPRGGAKVIDENGNIVE